MQRGPKTQICNWSLYVRRNESATSTCVQSLKKENALRLSLLLSISIVHLHSVARKLSQVRARGGRVHHKHGIFHPNTSWSHDKRDPAVNHKVSRLSNQPHDKSQLKRQNLSSLPTAGRQSRCFFLPFNCHAWWPTREYSPRVQPTCGRFQLFFATSHAEDYCPPSSNTKDSTHKTSLDLNHQAVIFWTAQRRTAETRRAFLLYSVTRLTGAGDRRPGTIGILIWDSFFMTGKCSWFSHLNAYYGDDHSFLIYDFHNCLLTLPFNAPR